MKVIRVKNEGGRTSIYVSGDIVDDCWHFAKDFMPEDVSTYPEDIRMILDGVTGPVDVYISSGGGDLFAGMAISNMLARYEGPTRAIVDGLAASAASLIAFGCDEIEIPSNAYLMIHKPLVTVCGNADDLLDWATTLDSLQEGLVETYARHTKGIGNDEINQMIDAETWLTGKKAADYFNVKVTGEEAIPQNVGACVFNYAKTPEVFKKNENSKLDEINATLELY